MVRSNKASTHTIITQPFTITTNYMVRDALACLVKPLLAVAALHQSSKCLVLCIPWHPAGAVESNLLA